MGDRDEAALHRHNVSSSSVKPSEVGKFVGTTSPTNLSKKEAEVLAQIKIANRRLEDLRSEYERAVVKMQVVFILRQSLQSIYICIRFLLTTNHLIIR